jgi:ribose-phosphate pyrophosphokinase
LSKNAVEKLESSHIDFLAITDSIPLPKEKESKKIKVVTVGKLFAEAIKRIHFEQSISVLFDSIRR